MSEEAASAAAQETPPSGPKETPPIEKAKKLPRCRFFNSASGCRRGDECRFAHDLKEDKNSKKAAKESEPQPPKPPAVRKPVVPVRIILKQDQIGASEQVSARKTELAYFKRRYRHCVVSTDDNGTTFISFKYAITEPDWVFDVKALSLTIQLAVGHPLVPPAVLIPAGENKQLPDVLRTHIWRTVNDAITAKYKIFASRNAFEIIGKALIHWLDHNVLSMFVDGLKKQRLTVQAAAAGISLVLPNSETKEETVKEADVCDTPSEEVQQVSTDFTNVSIKEDNSHETPSVSASVEPTTSATPAATLYEFPIKLSLVWSNISQNIASVAPVSLFYLLQCIRCKEERHQEVPAKGYREFRCSKCALTLSIRSQPELIHANSSVLAKLDCRGCKPLDLILLDCALSFICFECNTEERVQKINFGQNHKSWCKNCHNLCEFFISTARFSGDFAKCALPANPSSALPKVPKAKAAVTAGISPGNPLPKNGTCKHYSKSYRWFRFPCCGRVFPCDTCHEEANLGHEMKVANRMVCGHCSTEQSLTGSNTECKNCSQNVIRSRSHFWEGGKGCRDRTLMNKNDVHKFNSSHKKTAPKKKIASAK